RTSAPDRGPRPRSLLLPSMTTTCTSPPCLSLSPRAATVPAADASGCADMVRKRGGLDEEIDRLFGLSSEAFIGARDELATLLKAAEDGLREAGKGSAGTVDALLPRFEAASVDQEAGEALKAGRLERELAARSGFGGVTGLEVVAAPPERAKPRGAKAKAEDE